MTPVKPRRVPTPALLPPPAPHAADGAWELALCGELNEKESDLHKDLIDVPEGSRGTIYIDSGGGSVYAGMALATLIRLRRLQATAVVVAECSSAAILPFAACQKRLVLPHSTFLFHPGRWSSEEDARLEEAAEWARQFAVQEKMFDEIIARLLGIPVEKLRGWTRPGRYLMGVELVDEGLAEMTSIFEEK
ncbi:MAG: ATP-dependent Clp protease proteolytic subunit [Planctomycetota bacterium]